LLPIVYSNELAGWKPVPLAKRLQGRKSEVRKAEGAEDGSALSKLSQ